MKTQTAILSMSLALALAGQTPPAGESSLTVRVRDANGLPLSGAVVSIMKAGADRRWRTRRSGMERPPAPGELGRQRTGAEGEARFAGLEPGTVSVLAAADGFFPMEEDPVELAPGQETVISFQLQLRSVVSETVVVTGSGTESLTQEAPVKTELIQAAVVEREARTTLAEAFQAAVSGVRVEMNCQNCGFMQLRINGLEGPYTQVLEDGLPSYSGVMAVYGLEQVPAAFLEQIEVVKGGNSALYGPGAVAGVVNLIRREPRENHFRADASTGWHHGRPEQQAGAAAQLAPSSKGTALDLYYRGLHRTQIDRDGDGFSDLGRRRLNAGGASLFQYLLDGSGKLGAHLAVADEFRRGGDQFDKPPHETWITEQVASRRYALTLGWNHTLTPRTYYSLRASAARYRRATYYGSRMDPNAYGDTENPLGVADAQFAHQAGRHTVLGGYQITAEHVTDHAPAYSRTLGGTFRNQGLYLQDEWRASRRLTWIMGTRFDRSNQLTHWVASPRIGAKLGLGENLVWRATLSTGFRAPAIFDEDLHVAQVGGEGFLIQNGPHLREERSVSASSGLQYLGFWRGRRVEAGADLFWTRLQRTFTLAEDPVTEAGVRRLLRINGPGARAAGVNFDAAVRLTSRSGLRGGFTLQQARWDKPEPQFGARTFFRTPLRYGFLGFDWQLPGRIDWNGTMDFTGRMWVPHYAGFIESDRLERSPSFTVFNLVLSRTWPMRDEKTQLRLYLNVQNLGDAFQKDLDRGPLRDSSYVYGPFEMRRVVLGMSVQF